MRTRIIQDPPEPQGTHTEEKDPEPRLTLAARIGRWSATHRKLAIWGWLALVVALFMLVMNARVIETQRLTAAEQVAGEAGEAEGALKDAGLKPTEEIVLIENESLTVEDPAFAAVIAETERALKGTEHVVNVRSPSDPNGGSVSEDRHSAFVRFEVTGAEEDIKLNLDPSGRPSPSSRPTTRASRSISSATAARTRRSTTRSTPMWRTRASSRCPLRSRCFWWRWARSSPRACRWCSP